MDNRKLIGCKKCGGAVEVEFQPSPGHMEIRVRLGAEIHERSGRNLLICKGKAKNGGTCGAEMGEFIFKPN